MKILKNIENFGFVLKDGDEDVIVTKVGITTPLILDALFQNGYELVSADPVVFRKDGVLSTELPTIPKSELALSEDYEQYLIDMEADALTPQQLKMRLADDIKYEGIHFEKPIKVLINTREELLNFLDNQTLQRSEGQSMYLPLNAITAPEALFTPEEYRDSKYNTYVQKIEKRMQMSIYTWSRLLDDLKPFGINENSTPFDIMSTYLRWGIPGLRLQPYDIKTDQSDMNLSLKFNANLEYAGKLSYLNVQAFLDTNGEIHLPVQYAKNTKYLLDFKEDELERKRKALFSVGYREIEPIIVKVPEPALMTTMYCDDNWVVYYDAYTIVVSNLENGAMFSLPGFKVTAPSHPSDTIDVEYLNLLNEDIRKAATEEMKVAALARYAISRCLSDSDASSYKVLRNLSLDPVTAVKYILTSDKNTEMSVIADIQGVEDVSKIMLMTSPESYINGLIDAYASGTLSTNSKEYEVVDDIFQQVIEGGLNIGYTGQGQQADEVSGANISLRRDIRLLHNVMGKSYEEIYDKFTTIRFDTKDSLYLEFEGNGYTRNLFFYLRNKKQLGYEADLNDLKVKLSQRGKIFLWVTNVYTGLGEDKEHPRHVALKALQYVCSEKDGAYDEIKYKLEQRIRDTMYEEQAKKMLSECVVSIPRYIFTAFIKDTTQLPFPKALQAAGYSDTFDISWNALQYIKGTIQTRIDSLPMIQTELLSKFSGELRQIIVNCYIDGNRVLPKRGVKILEMPIMPMWEGRRGLQKEKAEFAAIQGMYSSEVPNAANIGVKEYYKTVYSINPELVNSPLSLRSYMDQAYDYIDNHLGDNPYDLPVLPFDDMYPELAEESEPVHDTLSYDLHATRVLEYDGYNQLKAPEVQEPETGVIKEFVSIDCEDLLRYDDIALAGVMQAVPEDRMRAVIVKPDRVTFNDGNSEGYSLPALNTLDESEYAIMTIANKRVVLDMLGRRYVCLQ